MEEPTIGTEELLRKTEQLTNYWDAALERRSTRLHKALGLHHFAIRQHLSSLTSLYSAGSGLSLGVLATEILRLAAEGIYLANNPIKLKDFISYGVFCANSPKDYLVPNLNALEYVQQQRQVLEREWEDLRQRYHDWPSWHALQEPELLRVTGMTELAPLIDRVTAAARLNPALFMEREKRGRYSFARRRESGLWHTEQAAHLAVQSSLHFYSQLELTIGATSPFISETRRSLARLTDDLWES